MSSDSNKFLGNMGDARLRPGSKEALERGIRHTQVDVRHLSEQIAHLEDGLDRLSVFSLGLWDLLKEKTGLSDDQLQESIAKVAEQRNEQTAAGAQKCPECGRVMSMKQSRCLYCAAS